MQPLGTSIEIAIVPQLCEGQAPETSEQSTQLACQLFKRNTLAKTKRPAEVMPERRDADAGVTEALLTGLIESQVCSAI